MPAKAPNDKGPSRCPLLPAATFHVALDRPAACSGPSCVAYGDPGRNCTDTATAETVGMQCGYRGKARHSTLGAADSAPAPATALLVAPGTAVAASSTPTTSAVLRQHRPGVLTLLTDVTCSAQGETHIVAHELTSHHAGLCGVLKSARSASRSSQLALHPCPFRPDRWTQRRWKMVRVSRMRHVLGLSLSRSTFPYLGPWPQVMSMLQCRESLTSRHFQPLLPRVACNWRLAAVSFSDVDVPGACDWKLRARSARRQLAVGLELPVLWRRRPRRATDRQSSCVPRSHVESCASAVGACPGLCRRGHTTRV